MLFEGLIYDGMNVEAPLISVGLSCTHKHLEIAAPTCNMGRGNGGSDYLIGQEHGWKLTHVDECSLSCACTQVQF